MSDYSGHYITAERDAWDPGDEAEDGEGAKNEEDDATRVVFAREHIYGCDEAPDDIQNSCNP